MPPARGVKSRCSVHNLQTRGEISRESSAVDLRRGNFASSGSITETAALSFIGADR